MFLGLFDSPIIPIFFIIVAIAIFSIISSFSLKPKHLCDNLQKILQDNQIDYTIIEEKPKCYTLGIMVNNQKYNILMILLEKHSEITINNKDTWEMHFGAGDRPGKAQPYKRLITEIPEFMHLSSDAKKVVILSPNAKQIVRWKNECEMVFVEPNTDIFGVNVINERDVKNFFE